MKQLIKLAQSGDLESYNQLIKQYSFKIKNSILYQIKDRSVIADLTQEVLIKIFRFLPYFKKESEFSTWLYQIIQNTIKNYYRAVSVRLDSEMQYCMENEDDQNQNPESIMMNIELSHHLELIFSELTDELRHCYGKHVFEGLTYESIAQQMGCPIGTVRSRIFRARKIMQDCMNKRGSLKIIH